MKIILLTQAAPAYLAPFLDDVLGGLAQTEHQVVAMVVLPPFFKASRWAELRDRYQFYGGVAFCQMLLYILFNKLRSYLNPRYGVVQVLQKHGIKRQVVAKVNHPDFIQYLQNEGIDLLVSVAFPKILKAPLLATPPKGCINYHTGLLPRYRGRMPLFWALYHDEPEVGITVHEMDAGIDSGAIILQARLPIHPNDSLHDLYLKTTQQGAQLLVAAIQKIGRGDAERLPNDASQATYFSFPSPEQAREFRQTGKRFF
jgi:methionyl-tRNA formyltransferase